MSVKTSLFSSFSNLSNDHFILNENEFSSIEQSYKLSNTSKIENFSTDINIFTIIHSIHSAFQQIHSTPSNSFHLISKSLKDLRILLKYQRRIFILVFNNIIDYFASILCLGTPSYNKAILSPALELTSEIFMSYHHESVYAEWVPLVLSKLFQLSVKNTDYSIIINKVIDDFIQCCYEVDEVGEILIEFIEDEDIDVAKKAGEVLGKLIKGGEEKRKRINFYRVLEVIGNIIDYNYEEYVKIALNVLENIKKYVSSEELIYWDIDKEDLFSY